MPPEVPHRQLAPDRIPRTDASSQRTSRRSPPGELEGAALRQALDTSWPTDPANPQAHLRLGYVLIDAGQCSAAEGHFNAAIAGHLPGADAYLGLAACQSVSRRFDAAARHAATGRSGRARQSGCRREPRRRSLRRRASAGHRCPLFRRALTLDPDFNEARFNLALAHLRGGSANRTPRARRTDSSSGCPADAPQRSRGRTAAVTAR